MKKERKHIFTFNPKDNGGEQLILETTFHSHDSGEIFETQELTLESYCNCATFTLGTFMLNPDMLRQLANELDREALKYKLEILEK